MKEPYRKGPATHPGSESCPGDGNIAGEALTGAHAGQVFSSEIKASACRPCSDKGNLVLKRTAVPGADGVTWEEYGRGLEGRLVDLHGRVQRGTYRAQPSKRAWIPKPDGGQRPLGIAALEDKIVQQAVKVVLDAIYEEDFLGFSYGYRPGRSAHDALDALWVGIAHRKVNRVLDADIRGFLDNASGCPLKNASCGAFRR
jgi:hypothetical protein